MNKDKKKTKTIEALSSLRVFEPLRKIVPCPLSHSTVVLCGRECTYKVHITSGISSKSKARICSQEITYRVRQIQAGPFAPSDKKTRSLIAITRRLTLNHAPSAFCSFPACFIRAYFIHLFLSLARPTLATTQRWDWTFGGRQPHSLANSPVPVR